jgi:hypothetical protein
MSLISFSCAAPVASWSPSRNPRQNGGYRSGKERFQPKGFCGSNFYVYDHGSVNIRVLEWAMLPQADMATLLTFLSAVHGGVHTFAFTDYDTTVYSTCRVLNFQEFPFKNATQTYYETMLELEVA